MKKNSLIILAVIGLIMIDLYEKVDYKVHTVIIDDVLKNANEYNKIDYIGYIEIEHLGIKREIKMGINDNNLKKYVCLKKQKITFL